MSSEGDGSPAVGLESAIPPEAASRWLVARLPELRAPLSFTTVGGGHSNITAVVEGAEGRRLVLRRPPTGSLPRGAHDVLREARITAAVAGHGVPVAPVLATCEDPGVIGAPFAVTGFVEGAVVDNPAAVERHLPTPASRRRASEDLVDALVALHAIDPVAAGLGDLVRGDEPFVQRQLRRYAGIWATSRTRDLPLMEDVHRRLEAGRPPQRFSGIVHSDFRLANALLGGDGSLRAVLDWELATPGDVLADLALLLNNWAAPGEAAAGVWMEVPPTCAGGFPDAEAVVARYVGATGRSAEDLDYYRAFAWWRMAVIAEGIRRRYQTGAMAGRSVDLAFATQRVERLAQLADAHLQAYGA